MGTLWNDVRYAARLLIKSPAFTVVAVATLAVGIGANTAIFSVVDAALLNPLPFPDADRLVVVTETVQRDALERRAFSLPDYRDLRDRSRAFDGIAAWSADTLTLSGADAPARQIQGEITSAAYFDLLGVTPVAGRVFTKVEAEERDAHAVAVVSHAYWQRELGGSPAAIGGTMTLNDRAFTIIGVLRQGFRGLDDDTDVWIPMGMLGLAESPRVFDQRGSRGRDVVARLKPGVSRAQANADVAAIFRQLEQAYPDTNAQRSAAVFGLQDETVGSLRPLLFTMLAAVGFVLLIACVNLANLLLARASTRQRETAIRAALGADRTRLVRQFVAEGLLLSVLGAAAGLLLSLWSIDAIVALAPAGLPSFVNPHLDWRVMAFVAAITCAAGLLLGLLPAFQGSRADLNEVLKDSARGSSGGRERARTRSVLVVAEVALSMLLLVGAGLMVRSFVNLQRIDVGFRADRALTMRVALPQKYQAGQLPLIAAELMARVAAVPGVQHVAIGTDAPFAGSSSATNVSLESSDPTTPDRGIRIYRHSVTPGFFTTLGAGLVSGRDFDARDTSGGDPVAIVSRRFAAKAWPGADPLGRRLTIGAVRGANPQWVKVVGVAPDLRYRSLTIDESRNPEDPDIYFPFAQRPDRTVSLLVSTTGAPSALTTPIRDAVHALDRDLPTYGEGSFSNLIAARMASFRWSAGVMSFFGLVALLLAGIGVYGLINYSVMQRRQEMGVRLALGAGRREIYALVLKDAIKLTAAGLIVGIAATLPSARLLSTQLYGVTPNDPATYGTIVALLLTVALGATLLPARRAARVDPMVALRAD
jgi:putative ABC transport system permease protein